MAYLFVHFREKITVDGEQVYFSVSQDGYNWELVNNGMPVLTSSMSTGGCRDIEIARLKEGGFVIITTDECIAKRYDENLNVDWSVVNRTGSHGFCMWKTDDLVSFSEQRIINIGRDDFGCMWAPEIFYDEVEDEYLIHWGSTVAQDNYSHMSIYYSVTKDFETFSKPKLFFTKAAEVLDTHITKIDGTYHLFYKHAEHPGVNMHAVSDHLYGPYIHDDEFEKLMRSVEKYNCYEADTTYVLSDGKWCFMLDFFGCEKEKMGYVPFISSNPGDMAFEMRKDLFSFPYGFKHGKVIEISDDEYDRVKKHYNK